MYRGNQAWSGLQECSWYRPIYRQWSSQGNKQGCEGDTKTRIRQDKVDRWTELGDECMIYLTRCEASRIGMVSFGRVTYHHDRVILLSVEGRPPKPLSRVSIHICVESQSHVP